VFRDSQGCLLPIPDQVVIEVDEHPLHQSAISKIEPADPDQRTGRRRATRNGERRSVTIGEAVGFAKVFDIPLGELLLPPGMTYRQQAIRALLDATQVRTELMRAQERYDALIRAVADELIRDPNSLQILPSLAETDDFHRLPNGAEVVSDVLRIHSQLRKGTTSDEA
jgi:hypothetical protein